VLSIDRITLREIHLALKEPFRISSGTIHERRIALLEFTDSDGASAWSECVAFQLPFDSPETIDTAWFAIREWLAPRVLGREFTGPEVIHEVLEENIRGHTLA
jgi:O-succinylbenzoate synthase